MKISIPVLLLGYFAGSLIHAGLVEDDFIQTEIHAIFAARTKEYSKSYETVDETKMRSEISKTNHAFIEAHIPKQSLPSYMLGHNQFSDFTVYEYEEYNKLGNHSQSLMTHLKSRSSESIRKATKFRKSQLGYGLWRRFDR